MKKILSLLLAAALVGSLLTACRETKDKESNEREEKQQTEEIRNEGDPDKPFAGQKITWAFTGAGFWEDKLKPIAGKFEEETGAEVEIEFYSHSDYLEMLQVKLESASDDYDMIGIDVPLVASYATKDWVLPLDQYFTDDEKEKFNDSALQGGSWEGKFYAPAMNSSSQLLWYNTALLKEAGIKMPESTVENRLLWEEVVEMAKTAIAKLDPDGSRGIVGITFGQVSRTYQMNEIPNSLGGKNIGDDGFTAEGIINGTEWIQGATWYQNLFKEGVALRSLTADNASNFFESGKVIFIIGATCTANNCEEKGMKDYDYAPVPAFKDHENQVGTPTGAWHFGVPKNAKNPELAAEFIKYMSIGKGNELWLKANGDVPATKAGVEALMDSSDAPGYMKIAAFESANTAVPRALTPGYTEYDTIIQNTWEDIKNGSDVKESLDNAAKKIDKAMEKWKH